MRSLCRTAVLIEDNLVYAESVKAHLSRAGFTDIEVVINGNDALEVIQRKKPALVLADIRLPGKDGLTICSEIRQLPYRKEMAVVMLTVSNKPNDSLRAGADAFVLKGQGPEVLVAQIEACLAKVQWDVFSNSIRDQLTLFVGPGATIRAESSGAVNARAEAVNGDLSVLQSYSTYEASGEQWRLWAKNAGRDVFFKQVFVGDVLRLYEQALTRDANLHLRFDGDAKLLAVPLEFTYDSTGGGDYLILRHSVSRRIREVPGTEGISPQFLNSRFKSSRPLRVLLVASNTKPDIPGVDQEIAEVFDMLVSLKRDKCYPIEVRIIPSTESCKGCFREEIQSKGSGGYDIVHFAGHGFHESGRPDQSFITFWEKPGKNGRLEEMRTTELRQVLRQSGTKLFFCSSCYGATTHPGGPPLPDDYLGVAESVVRAGVPAVVAFRQTLSDDGGVRFASAFYKGLAETGDIGNAVWRARSELYAIAANDFTWANPVLIQQD